MENGTTTTSQSSKIPWYFDASWNWVTWNVFVWLFPLLCTLGAVVNACAFFVIATNRKAFPYVTRQYMLVITMNDFSILTFKASTHYLQSMWFVKENAWTWYTTPRNVNLAICVVYDFLTYYALSGTQFFQLGLTVDRLIAVAAPLKAKQILSRKRSWALLALITSMALVFPIMYVSNRSWNSSLNACDVKSLDYVLNVYNPVDLYFGRVFLLSALVIGTVAICLLLVWNNRTARRMQLEAGTDSGKERNRSLIRITLILVFLNLTFLVTSLPYSIVSQLELLLKRTMSSDQYMILLRHLNTLVYANNALNWPLYFMGRNFRAAFGERFAQPCLRKFSVPSVSYRSRSTSTQAAGTVRMP